MTTLAALLRALLAATFVVSAVAKLLDRPASREAVRGFGTPAPLIGVVTTALPIAELLAAGLLLGDRPASRAGALLVLAMLAAFTAAIVNALLRGNQVECRCFGALSDKPLGWSSVVRNALLAAAALLVVLASDPGDDVVGWLRARTGTELVVGGLLVALSLTVFLMGKLLMTLVRKHGEVLLRLEQLEAGGVAGSAEPALAPRGPAAPFRLPSLDGVERSLDDLLASSPTGHLLVVFMAESCAPCTGLAPELLHWQRDHADVLPVAVVGSGAADGLRKKWRSEPTFPVLVSAGIEEQVQYGVDGTPAAVVVGPGRMVMSPVAAGADEIRPLVRRAAAALRGAPAQLEPQPRLHQLEQRPLFVGDPVPAAQVQTAEGQYVELADQLAGGKVVLFWDSLCGFCELMEPELAEWVASAQDPGLVVLTKDPVGTRIALPVPVLYDPGGPVASALGSPGTPSARRVDADGRVASEVAAGAPQVFELLGRAPAQEPSAT